MTGLSSFDPNKSQINNENYINPFPDQVEDKQENITQNETTSLQNETIEKPITHTNNVDATSLNRENTAAAGKGATRLGTLWSNINTLLGKTIPELPPISLRKMFSNVMTSMRNLRPEQAQSDKNVEKQQNAVKTQNTKFEEVKSGGEESEIEDDESAKELKTFVNDMLELAKNDPTAASQRILSPEQWIALAKTDPTATGKLLFDQTTPLPGVEKGSDLSEVVKKLGEKLTSTKLSQVASGAISREIERHPMETANGIATLLRANTVGLNLYREFSQRHLNPVLQGSAEMKSVMNSIPDKPYEDKDNTGLRKGQDKKFGDNLSAIIRQSYSFCINNQTQPMKDFKGILSQLDKDVKAKGGKDSECADTVNKFFFLRLISPILFTPDAILGEQFKYPPKSESNKQTNGTNLSKVSQNMVNLGDKMTTNTKITGILVPLNQIGSEKLIQMNDFKGKLMDELRK